LPPELLAAVRQGTGSLSPKSEDLDLESMPTPELQQASNAKAGEANGARNPGIENRIEERWV
jgi:hypothetical protein